MKKFRHILVVGMATTMLLGSVLDVSAAGLKDIFDAEYYADSYPDLKEAFGYDEIQLYNHFITYGLEEGRNMSPILDVVAYRKAYADLEAAFGDDWDAYVNHFFTYGAGEMRDQGVLFNPIIYADAYDDIKTAYGSDLIAIIRHYLIFGRAENRTIGTFNGYADMAAAGKAAQGAQQVTPDSASAPASALETPGTDVPGGNTTGGNVKNPNKTSVIWTNNGHTEYEYDERGNCISITVYDLEGNWRSTHYTFNSNNELVRSESRDEEGNCEGYDEYEYDGGKIKKKICYYGNGKVSYSTTYEWNGNTVTISGYDENGNLHAYIKCETDSRLNIIKEEHYNKAGNPYVTYEYTYDKNDNVLTQIGYNPDGTEASNQSFTYYENGTKKTETYISGDYKEIFEYNESGSKVSKETYNNNKLQEAETYEYYAEGPLAKVSCYSCYGDGSSSYYKEKDYDRQGRMQKETRTYRDSEGALSSEWVQEFAADGSYTISSQNYDSDGNLTSKWSETCNAQDKKVNEIVYIFSDGKVKFVTVTECDENGRIVKKSEYEGDRVTLTKATVYTYVETKYGYEQTIQELDSNGNVTKTEGYMCDSNGDILGSKNTLSDGGFVESWNKGEYKDQHWYYTAEGKLRRKEIRDGGITTAASEFDENGNEIKLVYDPAKNEWVRPSVGSGSGVDALTTVFSGDESGADALITETGSSEPGSDETSSDEPGSGESGSDESGSDEPGSDEPSSSESGSGESGSSETGSSESGSGEPGSDESGSDESSSDESGGDESGSDESGNDAAEN